MRSAPGSPHRHRTRHTEAVRIYLPATLRDLDPTSLADPGPRRAHAVTPGLRAVLPEEDLEGLEHAAHLAAADDSVLRLAADPSAPRLRVVVTAEVDATAVVPCADPEAAPSAVEVRGPIRWDQVRCAHVDEPAAAEDVTAAAEGSPAARDRTAERDLLWYDVSELPHVVAEHVH